jgi:hypothetical protein
VDESSKISVNGWEQGSVLSEELARDVWSSTLAEGTEPSVLVVLTQDCDLVHASYEVEPHVELIVGRLVDVADNNLRHGRNPRRLQVDVDGAEKRTLALSIHDRLLVPRARLESHTPHGSIRLRPDQRQLICEWVAKRYVRAAFPDEFNERTRASYKKIEKELKRDGEHITGLFLMIDPDRELGADEDYRAILRVTARRETLVDVATEQRLVRVANAIATALGSCKGIVVEDHQLVSEAEFTLEDLRYFKRWDWDYRSHSGEPGGEVAPVP